MTRNDWVFVAVRVFGLYLAVQGLLGVFGLVVPVGQGLMEGGRMNVGWAAIVYTGLRFAIGATLFLGAPAILAWLERKDRRLES